MKFLVGLPPQWLLALSLCLSPLLAEAEQSVRAGDYELHYIAMVSTELAPEIARIYGIERSKKRGVLILNLQGPGPKDGTRNVASSAEGRIRNLIGQERLRELRQVEEQDTQYWIADFAFSHLETMRFDFSVDPEGPAGPIELKFSQQFYTPGR